MTDAPAIGTSTFAARDALLSPRMLISRTQKDLPAVLRHPDVRYHYLGRNASFALCRGLGLAGQEMLFPAFFGPPVVQAPVEAGVSIRFYPVRPDLSVSIDDIRSALTPNTRAIYLIHFNGFPAPIDAVMELAAERNLIVIEDAAHALLTTINNRAAGSIGDGAIYSFYKWVPVPNGAALTTNRASLIPIPHGSRRSLTSGVALSTFSLLDYAAREWGAAGAQLRDSVRAIGRKVASTGGLEYVSTGGIEFHHDELDYAMSQLSHRILRAQNWSDIAARRRRNYTLLADLLADVAPSLQGDLPPGTTPLFYATSVENKREVLARLAARGIQGRNFWGLHHDLLSLGTYPALDELRRTTLELPIHQDLDAEDIRKIAAAMRVIIGPRVRWINPESDAA